VIKKLPIAPHPRYLNTNFHEVKYVWLRGTRGEGRAWDNLGAKRCRKAICVAARFRPWRSGQLEQLNP
jgi:hypothetical protein